MPDWLLKHEYLHHFMRGYFDGDGCISKCSLVNKRKVVQKSFNILGTFNFINAYKIILEKNCNINCNKICKKGNIYSISYSGNVIINNIYNFLYKDATIYLERKKYKF